MNETAARRRDNRRQFPILFYLFLACAALLLCAGLVLGSIGLVSLGRAGACCVLTPTRDAFECISRVSENQCQGSFGGAGSVCSDNFCGVAPSPAPTAVPTGEPFTSPAPTARPTPPPTPVPAPTALALGACCGTSRLDGQARCVDHVSANGCIEIGALLDLVSPGFAADQTCVANAALLCPPGVPVAHTSDCCSGDDAGAPATSRWCTNALNADECDALDDASVIASASATCDARTGECIPVGDFGSCCFVNENVCFDHATQLDCDAILFTTFGEFNFAPGTTCTAPEACPVGDALVTDDCCRLDNSVTLRGSMCGVSLTANECLALLNAPSRPGGSVTPDGVCDPLTGTCTSRSGACCASAGCFEGVSQETCLDDAGAGLNEWLGAGSTCSLSLRTCDGACCCDVGVCVDEPGTTKVSCIGGALCPANALGLFLGTGTSCDDVAGGDACPAPTPAPTFAPTIDPTPAPTPTACLCSLNVTSVDFAGFACVDTGISLLIVPRFRFAFADTRPAFCQESAFRLSVQLNGTTDREATTTSVTIESVEGALSVIGFDNIRFFVNLSGTSGAATVRYTMTGGDIVGDSFTFSVAGTTNDEQFRCLAVPALVVTTAESVSCASAAPSPAPTEAQACGTEDETSTCIEQCEIQGQMDDSDLASCTETGDGGVCSTQGFVALPADDTCGDEGGDPSLCTCCCSQCPVDSFSVCLSECQSAFGAEATVSAHCVSFGVESPACSRLHEIELDVPEACGTDEQSGNRGFGDELCTCCCVVPSLCPGVDTCALECDDTGDACTIEGSTEECSGGGLCRGECSCDNSPGCDLLEGFECKANGEPCTCVPATP